MDKISIKLTDKALKELKSKYNSNSLGKAMNAATAQKLLYGNANITLRNYVKLCEMMDWDIPKYIDKE